MTRRPKAPPAELLTGDPTRQPRPVSEDEPPGTRGPDASAAGHGAPRAAFFRHPRDMPAELRLRVLRAVQIGMPVSRAAALARVRPGKLREWLALADGLQDGADGDAAVHPASNDAVLVAFAQDVAETSAVYEWELHKALYEAADPARMGVARWQLERRYPEDFGGKGGTVVNTGTVVNIDGVADNLALLESMGVTIPAEMRTALAVPAPSAEGAGGGR